jgi:glutaminyl-peptide cyclotransferase
VPHPGRGFTQGLITDAGTVWESTGGYGTSALCRYRLGAEQTARRAVLAEGLFGEGICRAGDVIWQLTWQERVALRWDAVSLEPAGQVRYNRQGWGICAVEDYVVTSDGTSELVRRDPLDLAPQQVIHVRYAGRRVLGLNDLAYAQGTIWANVAGTAYLAGIDPDSGEITDVVNAGPAAERHPDPQVILNGIAALPAAGEFLLTGKNYRSIRHVRLKPARLRVAPERLLSGLSH